jgi:peptide/nickel transport system substrate-binding protein
VRRRVARIVALLAVALSIPTEAATLRVGGTQAPPALGNPFTAVGPPSSLSWSAIFDGLTVLDERGRLQPALADSWQNTTPTTWVFRLRPGIAFHNGKPCDAAAVAATFAYLKSDDAKRFLISNELRMVTQVRAVDPLTVEFTTSSPDPILPTRLNLVMIVEPEAWRSLKPEGFALAPIGTGPFRLAEWGRGNGRAVLEADAHSWRGRGAVDRVEIRTIADTAARMQALMAKQIDIAIGIGPEDAALLEQDGFKVRRQPYAAVMALAFRTVRPEDTPLKDRRVRYALNLAVDRAAILKNILGGTGGVASQGATPETFGYDPTIAPYPFDPARAKALLAEAGYPDGFAFVAEVLTNMTMSDSAVYQKVAADLDRIGVTLRLRTTTFASWVRRYTSGDWGDADAFSLTWSSAPFQDVIRPVEYYSCAKVNPFFCDRSLMPLIAAANQDMVPASREKRLQEIMRRLHDVAPALLLVDVANIIVTAPRVENLHARFMGIDFERLTLNP